MSRFLLVLSAFAAFTLTSCITLKPAGTRPGAAAQVIPDMPLRVWGDNTCGAGALATVLNHYGDQSTESELIQSLQRGRNGGVVSVDLLIKARAEGFESSLVRGSPAIVQSEMKAGRPVILMLKVVDLPGESRDLFHYIVVDGIDPARGLTRMQFGDGKARWTALSSIEKPWQQTGYATMLIERKDPGRIREEADLKRAVALESCGEWDEAIAIYSALLNEHPDDPLLQVDLGNAQSAAGKRAEAETSFRKALSIDDRNRDALNNLAWLLFTEGRATEAETLARKAASISGDDDDLIFDTLGEILAAGGNCSEASTAFSRALQSVPAARTSSRASLFLRLGRAQSACGMTSDARRSFAEALDENPGEGTRKEIEAAAKAL